MNSKTLQSIATAATDSKTMASPHKMQQYLDRHRLKSLFEHLMNKVVHDQPDDPMVYLIKELYKKAGLDVPNDLPDVPVRRSSVERPDDKDRSYNKPWLSNSKKNRTRQSEDSTVTRQGRRQDKQGWNSDTKVNNSGFDDLFDEKQEREEAKKVQQTKKTEAVTGSSGNDTQKSWGNVDLVDDGDYTSGHYRGPKVDRDDDDPLAGELRNRRDKDEDEEEERETKIRSTSRHTSSRNTDTTIHQDELRKLVLSDKKKSYDSGYVEEDDEPDEAIEMLEDADDLKKEGVTNVEPTGYKLSRVLRQREEDASVKVNINVYAGHQPADSVVDDGHEAPETEHNFYDSEEERPQTGMSGFRSSPGNSDLDEFESVSQVTGPRRPVWNDAPQDSDGEQSYTPKLSKTLPEPSKSRKLHMDSGRKFASTTSGRHGQPYPSKSMESADSFLEQPMNKTWAPGNHDKSVEIEDPSMSCQESVNSEAGGWKIPQYESETSVADWSQYEGRTKGKRADPRAY